LTVFDVDGRRIGPTLLALAERNALAKATTEEERVIRWNRRGAWRAWPEFEVVPDDEGPAIMPWDEIPPDEYDRREFDFDPEVEAERQAAEQGELEALIDAAIDFEHARQERIDAVRVANGLPPRPRRKRMRIVLRNPPGREG
jgi:hypothetical protein